MELEHLFLEIESLFNSESRRIVQSMNHVSGLYYFDNGNNYHRYYLGYPKWWEGEIHKFNDERGPSYLTKETLLQDPVRWFFITVLLHLRFYEELMESEKETDLMLFSYLRNLNDDELKSLEGPLVEIFFNRAFALCELNYRFWR
jgi:hypothetical protein